MLKDKQVNDLNPNTFNVKNSLDNLKIIILSLKHLKKTLINYVNNLNELSSNLSLNINQYEFMKSLNKFSGIQKIMLNEIKLIKNYKLCNNLNSLFIYFTNNNIDYNGNINNLSLEQSNIKNYFVEDYELHPIKINTRFKDNQDFNLFNIPIFIINHSIDDSLTIKVIYSDNEFNSNKIKYFWINRMYPDSYLLKYENNDYDLNTKNNIDFNEININKLLNLYNSIINYESFTEKYDEHKFNDIKLLFDFIDNEIFKINNAIKTICLRNKILI